MKEEVLYWLSNEYIRFLLIIVGTYIFSKLFHYIVEFNVKKFAKKTKTKLDDYILDTILEPLHFFILLSGVYFAIKSLSIVSNAALIDRIYFVLFVIFVAFSISRVIAIFIMKHIEVRKGHEKTPQLLSNVIASIVYLIAFLMILGYFGIDITPLITTLGIGGLAVGLALQGTLTNFFAGLNLISDRPISVGDYIEIIGQTSGYVEDIGWRSTRIRTEPEGVDLPNTVIVIPNAKLAESTIINHNLPTQDAPVIISCGVAYGSDLKKVEKITLDVAESIQNNVNGAVKKFKPIMRFKEFGDSNINFIITLRVKMPKDRRLVTHEFIKALKARYDKEGIEISWPVRKVYQYQMKQ